MSKTEATNQTNGERWIWILDRKVWVETQKSQMRHKNKLSVKVLMGPIYVGYYGLLGRNHYIHMKPLKIVNSNPAWRPLVGLLPVHRFTHSTKIHLKIQFCSAAGRDVSR